MRPTLLAAVVLLAAAPDGRTAEAGAPPAATGSPASSIVLRARAVEGRPDLDASATGDVELTRDGVTLRADRLSYDQIDDRVRASGGVEVRRPGITYRGPSLELQVQRFEGFFEEPRFEFEMLGAGGGASRVELLGPGRARAFDAYYTSCPREGPDEPAWVLRADRVDTDLDRNEGIAEGAELRFLGTPILALPRMSFPLGRERKSGWLPPTIALDSRSGLDVAVPYYWNIAPQRDATIAPRLFSRRGAAIDAEFRYLEPGFAGEAELDLLPNDRLTGTSRSNWRWVHDGVVAGLRYGVDATGVSDDDWWKDFAGDVHGWTPRLLARRAFIERDMAWGGLPVVAYARAEEWQVLQDPDAPITLPFQRSPQVGLRVGGRVGVFETSLETEFNRFTRPSDAAPGSTDDRPDGSRLHAVGSIARPWRLPGGWITPRLAFNAAGYRVDRPLADGRTEASRVIPTLSVDGGLQFDRRTTGFGRELRQTLEPRLLYVNTPYREQADLPNFDSAGKDFNVFSIFSENDFSGVDRVSDAHRLTAGVTTRMVGVDDGVEALRLSLVQRYQFRDQQVAPATDGSVDGPPIDQRFSDVLLIGSTSVIPGWALEAGTQYSASIDRTVRSIVSARWSPGPFRTIAASYRLSRGSSETTELGWQWPLFRGDPADARRAGGRVCESRWYTVGRINYSLLDNRLIDGLAGFEADAGCWIARVVAEWRSTGRDESTTRVMLQLEFVGLSRLGSNPLRVLRDNIPGYRLLRDEEPAR